MANGCAHLDLYKSSTGLEPYKVIHAIFVMSSTSQTRKAKLKNSFCYICRKSGPLLHSCLHCVFLGCHKHIREHTDNKVKHCLSVDLCYGQIHCSQCKDYVYDKDIDKVAFENKSLVGKFHRKMLSWTTKNISESNREAIEKYGTKIDTISLESTVGLRGLLKLGETCFMNSVIQAVTHTPLLRDYIFTDIHQCENLNTCLISKLFYEFYSGEKTPLSLHEILYEVWTKAEHLAGYKQQDAHEFLIALLGILHQHFEDSMPESINNENNILECNCIVHRIFTGCLQSDVVCQQCNGVSTTFQAMSEFLLDLKPVDENIPTSVIQCLEYLTRAENLELKIECSICKSPQVSTKKDTWKTLPIVVTICLKRFQYLHKVRVKISSFISFPEILDMTPFTNQYTSKTHLIVPPDNRYYLFAVINHIGDPSLGHYVCFIRHHNFWFKCDDSIISRVTLADVLNSEAYLLFYHKHILAYD